MKDITDKINDKTIKEKYGIDMEHTLHLIRGHDLVGALMKKAFEQGEFDNLEGLGKPLNLNQNPYEQSDLHMAHKILKDNGFAPYWIELGKEINTLKIKLEQDVELFKRYTRLFFEEKRSSMAIRWFNQKRNNFYIQSRERLEDIYKKILDYNLHCPILSLTRINLDVDVEMQKIITDIKKLSDNLQ